MSKNSNIEKMLKNISKKASNENFTNNLKKKLVQKAPYYLETKISYTFLPIFMKRKWRIAVFVVFIASFVYINFSAFFSQKDIIKREDIINRVYAAYSEDWNSEILYQKSLVEMSNGTEGIVTNFIRESWGNRIDDNFLYLIKKIEDGKIVEGGMIKKINGQEYSFTYSHFNELLDLLRSNDPNLLNRMGGPVEGTLTESYYTVIQKAIPDEELRNLLYNIHLRSWENGSGIKTKNLSIQKNNFSFELVDIMDPPEETLFTVKIDKDSGIVTALNTQTQKELTDQDYKHLKKQLYNSLEKNKKIAEEIEKNKALTGPQYYCFERFFFGEKQATAVLNIAEKNHAIVSSYGISGPTESAIEKEQIKGIYMFNQNLEALRSLQLNPERVKNILDRLKNERIVKYDEQIKNGKKYYVFTFQVKDETERYFFDAETYRLAKEEIISHKNENTNYDNNNYQGATSSATYLESYYIDKDEAENIFDPQKYEFSPEVSIITRQPDKNMEPGCYNPQNQRLSAEEQTKIFQKITTKDLQEFESFKKSLKESLKR